jgi:hypothetical protein
LRRLRLITLALCVGSFALSIALTSSQAPWAFYGLPTRAWQLFLGALLAMHAPALARLPSRPAALGGWIGLGLLGIASVTLQPATGYPGFAALLPSVGIALVITSGDRRGGPGRLLSVAPLRVLGRISFSLYLYHWPVLILASMVFGPLSPALRWSFVVLAVAIAAASWRLVEEPFRRARPGLRTPGRSLAFAASTICVVLMLAQLVGAMGASSIAASEAVRVADVELVSQPQGATIAVASTSLEPASVMTPSAESAANAAGNTPAPAAAPAAAPTMAPVPHVLRPRIADARFDGDALTERGCGLSLVGSQPPLCQLGVADGAVSVALVGDSHAAQWFPALDVIARQRGWKLLPFTKDSCIFLDMRIVSINLEREYTECAKWREHVVVAIQRARPDLVVIASSRWVHPVLPADADAQRQADAMVRLLKRLPSRVALIADTPLNDEDIPACLSRADRSAADCATSRSYALTKHLARDGRVAEMLGATLIDPTAWLCGPAVCPAIIDWTIVYRDDHHLTATMVRRLAPLLEPGLLDALSSHAVRPAVGGGGG